jgi:hypothetical protein
VCQQVHYGASPAWTELRAWGAGGSAACSPDANSAAAALRSELESLAGQVLEELVRDGLWGVPTHTPSESLSAEAPERRLTPQVMRRPIRSPLYDLRKAMWAAVVL